MEKLTFEEQTTHIFENEHLPNIIRLTHNCDNPNWFYNYHRHEDQCEIVFVVNGGGTYIHDVETCYLKPGDMVLRNKQVIHCESSDPENPLDAWALTLSDVHVAGLGADELLPPAVSPVIELGKYADSVREIFEMMYSFRKNGAPNSKYLCQLLTCAVLAYAYHLMPAADMAAIEKQQSLILEIKNYIDLHYAEHITLDSLAKVFHVSPSYISHKMTELIGISPINYLIKRRIGEAQLLIVSTGRPTSQIARLVGYENVDHFNNLFYKCSGMTSREFRESYAGHHSSFDTVFADNRAGVSSAEK